VLKLKDSLPPHPGPSWFPAARRAIQTFLFEQGDVTRVIRCIYTRMPLIRCIYTRMPLIRCAYKRMRIRCLIH
jgi:hypothetical protein